MSFVYIHIIDFILSLVTIFLLIRLLNRSPKNEFLTKMIVLPMVLMINIALYSGIYAIDSLDGVLFSVSAYNWWSSFIRLQDIVTILWLVILGLRRIKK